MKIKLLQLMLFPLAGFAQIQFAPFVEIPTSSWAEVVAIGDLNNDGLNDVVVGTGFYFDAVNDYKIHVFLQNSLGYLDSAVKYSYPESYPGLNAIDLADLNNDNRLDVVIGYGTNIGIFYQNAGGALNPVNEIAVGQTVMSLKAADLNSDGLKDFAVSCASGSNLKVFAQQTEGGFSIANYANPNNNETEIEIADINLDGKNDIICMAGPGTVNVYLQTASNVFNGFIPNSGEALNGLAVGDLNNDGRPDLAASRGGNSPSAKISLWMQNPTTGLMNPSTQIAAYDIPEPIEIVDLNNDGQNEIITAHSGWTKVSVYEQNPVLYNTYSLYNLPYASSYNLQGLDVGDINDDGKKDVAIADYNHGLVILYNSSTMATPDSALQDIKIYPNPVRDFLNIDAGNSSSLERVELYNSVGALVMDIPWSAGQSGIATGSLPSGVYFLKVGKSAVRKIIKI